MEDTETYKRAERFLLAALEHPPWRRGEFLAEFLAVGDERCTEVVNLLGLNYLGAVLRYVMEVNHPLTRSELEEMRKQLPQEAGALMETIASTWIEEGMQKGLQQGRQEAGVELTLRQLQLQIREVNAPAQARIRKLSFEQLAELSEALLDFESAKDLTAWLRTRAGKG
jgi:hypothetical protein